MSQGHRHRGRGAEATSLRPRRPPRRGWEGQWAPLGCLKGEGMSSDLSVRDTEGWMESGPEGAGWEGQSRQSVTCSSG